MYFGSVNTTAARRKAMTAKVETVVCSGRKRGYVQERRPDPTPDEIRQRAAEIRRGWGWREMLSRSSGMDIPTYCLNRSEVKVISTIGLTVTDVQYLIGDAFDEENEWLP